MPQWVVECSHKAAIFAIAKTCQLSGAFGPLSNVVDHVWRERQGFLQRSAARAEKNPPLERGAKIRWASGRESQRELFAEQGFHRIG
jgi:hypothetical protein